MGWYILSPIIGACCTPAKEVYKQNIPDVSGNLCRLRGTFINPYQPDAVVYVKPPGARWTTP